MTCRSCASLGATKGSLRQSAARPFLIIGKSLVDFRQITNPAAPKARKKANIENTTIFSPGPEPVMDAGKSKGPKTATMKPPTEPRENATIQDKPTLARGVMEPPISGLS